MIKCLRSIVDWLERKFPDKLVITKAQFEKLESSSQLILKNETQIMERLKKVEDSLQIINSMIGFNATQEKLKSMALFR